MGRRTAAAAAAVVLALLGHVRLVAPTAATATATAAEKQEKAEETAVMLRLRELARFAASPEVAAWQGWLADDTSPPCSWHRVTCNGQGRITKLALWARPLQPFMQQGTVMDNATLAAAYDVLADFAKLQWLADLAIGFDFLPPGCMAPQWCQPGALPRLTRLSISARCLKGNLPDIQPGAMPALETLLLSFRAGETPLLPASWGSTADTLPALRSLHMNFLHAAVRLPAEWGQGFKSLEVLKLNGYWDHTIPQLDPGDADTAAPADGNPLPTAAAAAAAAATDDGGGGGDGGNASAAGHGSPAAAVAPEGGGLPPAWAAGFPRLSELTLTGLAVGGSLPAAWAAASSFPALHSLSLGDLDLTGTLPPHLFINHPLLSSLWLRKNELSGSLPGAWAVQQLHVLDVGDNRLRGQLFPDAWLAPGALPNLHVLGLSFNPNLTGTLPAQLPLPALRQLELEGVNIQGSVPEGWCTAPFAPPLFKLWVNVSGGPKHTLPAPPLPPCAVALAQQLADSAGMPAQQQPNGTVAGAVDPEPAREMLMMIVLATLLPLAVAAAAVAAGRAFWKRRLRCMAHTQQQQQQRDRESLLRRGRGSDGRAGGGSGGGAATTGASGSGAGRWARLAAVVRSMVGSDRAGIELMPAGQLPSALVHQLGRHRGSAGGAAGGGASAAFRSSSSHHSGLPAPGVSAASSCSEGSLAHCQHASVADAQRLFGGHLHSTPAAEKDSSSSGIHGSSDGSLSK